MGNSLSNAIQAVNDKVRLIASQKTWIESDAVRQLEQVAQFPNIIRAVGLPDLHAGRGYPIGAAFLAANKIYPALIGNDIGCGMSLWQTSLNKRKLKLDKIEKKLRQSAFVDQSYWAEQGNELLQHKFAGALSADLQSRLTLFEHSIGTIGGGNHFAELQAVTEVYDPITFAELKLDSDLAMLLVHSGSRGLGESILQAHISQFAHCGLNGTCDHSLQYLSQHQMALGWAEVNRQLIAERMMAAINTEGEAVIDINHNFVESVKGDDADIHWLHRKGVTPASQGCVIIPGSRGAASYLVKPLNCAVSLDSLAHGAGRKWQRGECKGRLSAKYPFKQLSRTSLGSRVICDDKDLIYEEAPEAYKSIDSVIQDLLNAGLVALVAQLQPVLTYKQANQGKGC